MKIEVTYANEGQATMDSQIYSTTSRITISKGTASSTTWSTI